jgi:hypothetical protein
MKWIFSVSIFVAIAMGYAATARVPAATASIDDVSLKFLPPETQGIGFVDVAALRSTPLVRDALKGKALGVPDGAANFLIATGFNPEQDVDKITLAKLSAREGLLVAQGRIDRFKVEQYVKDHGKPSEAYLGQTIYLDGRNSFLILDNVVLFGETRAVKKGIEQMQLPGSQPLRGDLTARIQSIDTGNQVWAVGDFSMKDLSNLGVRAPAPVLEMLKSLQSGTYQMRVDTGIHAGALGNFGDAESVRNLTDLAQGALTIAKLQFAKQRPEMLPVLDGIVVSGSGTTLTVRVEQSAEQLKLLKNLKPALEKIQ